jgi:hypothetical protein
MARAALCAGSAPDARAGPPARALHWRGMLLASEVYVRAWGYGAVLYARLMHPSSGPCIVRCRYRPISR